MKGGDELAAALRFLEAEDLEGKVVSADAGLLRAPFVHKVVEKEEMGWPGVQWCGWMERKREVFSSGQVEKKSHIWVAGAAFRWTLTAEQAAALFRQHWEIENGVFCVRDVSMDEDRLHGRKIGYGLS